VSSFVHVRVGGWDVIGAQVQSAALCTKYVFVTCDLTCVRLCTFF